MTKGTTRGIFALPDFSIGSYKSLQLGFLKLLESNAFCAFAIGITTFILYSRVLTFDYIELDDPVYTFQNTIVQKGLSMEGLRYAFSEPLNGMWHPLTVLSFMLEIQLFGMHPSVFHLTNLWLHVGNSILVLFVLRSFKLPSIASVFIVAVFAWHPASAENVIWISERKGLLSTFFGLLSLITYCRYVSAPSKVKYCIFLGLFSLGCLAKPMLLSIPMLLLLLDYWPLKRFSNEQIISKPVLWLLFEKIPLFVISFLITIISIQTQNIVDSVPWAYRISNAIAAYAFYFLKFFLPFNMSIEYPRPSYWHQLDIFIAICLLVPLTYFAVRCFTTHPSFFVGWFWFIFSILPVCGLMPYGPHWVAHRYSYIPYIGLSIALICGIIPMILGLSKRHATSLLVLAGAFPVYLLILTWLNVPNWKNSETVFKQALLVDPNNYIALINYGKSFVAKGRFDEAVNYNLKSVAENPTPQAYSNLGNIEQARGRYFSAAMFYESAANGDPNNSIYANRAARYLLVTSTLRRNNDERAFNFAIRACELTSYQNPEFLDTLACLYAKEGDYLSAVHAAESGIHLASSGGAVVAANDLKGHLVDFLQQKYPKPAWAICPSYQKIK